MDMEKIAVLAPVCLLLVMVIITSMFYGVNRKKSLFMACMSILYAFFSFYYVYLSFIVKTPKSIIEQQLMDGAKIAFNAGQKNNTCHSGPAFLVILDAKGKTFSVTPGETMETTRNMRFRMMEVKTPNGAGEIRAI